MSRITAAKLKKAAALAKAEGVRVRVGDYVFEPANEEIAIKRADEEEAERIQKKLDAMGRV